MSKIKKALYTAIESKDLSRTLSVLSDAPELLAEHIAGVTVMHLACDSDFLELIPELVSLGVSVDALGKSE